MKESVKIIALGGNEVAPVDMIDEFGKPVVADIPMQWRRIAETCKVIADIIEESPDSQFVITHGNGPQIGDIILRAEHSLDILPPLPIDVCGAYSQGAMAYMIVQTLNNELRSRGIDRDACGIITRVVVDKSAPDFHNPSKFIGPAYSKDEIIQRKDRDGWYIKLYKMDSMGNEIWRRVVPSPDPIDIVEMDSIFLVLRSGKIPIAVGGGGIPAVRVEPDENRIYHCNYEIDFQDRNNSKIYSGVEAVIDKDLATALLGKLLIEKYRGIDIDAEITLIIFTAEDGAKLNYQKPDQKDLRVITLKEAKRYYNEGHFPPGSMGPKMRAIIDFIEAGGKRAYISRPDKYKQTVAGIAGTTVINE